MIARCREQEAIVRREARRKDRARVAEQRRVGQRGVVDLLHGRGLGSEDQRMVLGNVPQLDLGVGEATGDHLCIARDLDRVEALVCVEEGVEAHGRQRGSRELHALAQVLQSLHLGPDVAVDASDTVRDRSRKPPTRRIECQAGMHVQLRKSHHRWHGSSGCGLDARDDSRS